MTPRPRVAILDHGMGNMRSVQKALTAAGADTTITSATATIEGSDALCVPGQGIFGRCVRALTSTGTDDLVREWIAGARPFLGICLGMQVLFTASEEDGVPGLGVFEGNVTRLPRGVRVPHIGWNEIEPSRNTWLERKYFYFDHSYAVLPADARIVAGWCDHGIRFAAAIETGPLLGVQFHPEKSGDAGIELLRRWVAKIAHMDASTMETRA